MLHLNQREFFDSSFLFYIFFHFSIQKIRIPCLQFHKLEYSHCQENLPLMYNFLPVLYTQCRFPYIYLSISINLLKGIMQKFLFPNFEWRSIPFFCSLFLPIINFETFKELSFSISLFA